MTTEAKPGELTLIYNTEEGAHPVALTRQQHTLLQAFMGGLSADEPLTVLKRVKVHYKDSSPEAMHQEREAGYPQ